MKPNAYALKLHRVCDYIYRHLDEDLTVETLSDVAHFSKYHFHRQFSEYVGLSVFKFIQLTRLKRASYQLVFEQEKRIIDIALQAHFESHESFSRAFKKQFGITPTAFRKAPLWEVWHQQYQFKIQRGKQTMQVEIIDFPETLIAVLEHRGAPAKLNESVGQFIEWRQHSQLSPVTQKRTFGLAYDDPNTTEPSAFRFDICGEVASEIPENLQGVINKRIPAGRCAKIRHFGSHDDIDKTIYGLYGDWLPQSGQQPRDFPCFFEYLNFFPEVAEHELITDIYLPLKS